MFFPLLHDLPFVEGVSFSLIETPSVDFDLRVLGRADLMGVPALSQWLHSLIFGQAIDGMLWCVDDTQVDELSSTSSQAEHVHIEFCRRARRAGVGPASAVRVRRGAGPRAPADQVRAANRLLLLRHPARRSSVMGALRRTGHGTFAVLCVRPDETARNAGAVDDNQVLHSSTRSGTMPEFGETFCFVIHSPMQCLRVRMQDTLSQPRTSFATGQPPPRGEQRVGLGRPLGLHRDPTGAVHRGRHGPPCTAPHGSLSCGGIRTCDVCTCVHHACRDRLARCCIAPSGDGQSWQPAVRRSPSHPMPARSS